jgi:hypothetical protein
MRDDETAIWEKILVDYPDTTCPGHKGGAVCPIHVLNMRRVLAAWAVAIDVQAEGNSSLAFRLLMTIGDHVQTIGDHMLNMVNPIEMIKINLELMHPDAHVIVVDPTSN